MAKVFRVLIGADAILYTEPWKGPNKMYLKVRASAARSMTSRAEGNPIGTACICSAVVGYKFQPKTGELTLCRIENDKANSKPQK